MDYNYINENISTIKKFWRVIVAFISSVLIIYCVINTNSYICMSTKIDRCYILGKSLSVLIFDLIIFTLLHLLFPVNPKCRFSKKYMPLIKLGQVCVIYILLYLFFIGFYNKNESLMKIININDLIIIVFLLWVNSYLSTFRTKYRLIYNIFATLSLISTILGNPLFSSWDNVGCLKLFINPKFSATIGLFDIILLIIVGLHSTDCVNYLLYCSCPAKCFMSLVTKFTKYKYWPYTYYIHKYNYMKNDLLPTLKNINKLYLRQMYMAADTKIDLEIIHDIEENGYYLPKNNKDIKYKSTRIKLLVKVYIPMLFVLCLMMMAPIMNIIFNTDLFVIDMISFATLFIVIGVFISYTLDIIMPVYKFDSRYKTLKSILIDLPSLINRHNKKNSTFHDMWNILSNASFACGPFGFMFHRIQILGDFLLLEIIGYFMYLIYQNIFKPYELRKNVKGLRKDAIKKDKWYLIIIYLIIIFFLMYFI